MCEAVLWAVLGIELALNDPHSGGNFFSAKFSPGCDAVRSEVAFGEILRAQISHEEVAVVDDLSKLPKDEEQVNKDTGDAAIRVVEVIEKNKHRIKPSKRNKLVFPKMKFYRYLRRMTRLRVADTAPVFMAAIVKYLVEEVFCLAHECMIRQRRKRITPQHIGMGVRIDDELGQLFRGITIPSAGRFGTYYLTH